MKITVRVQINGRELERDYVFSKEDITNSAYLGALQYLMEDAVKYAEEREEERAETFAF